MSHSSFVRRTAPRCAASCLASVVLPAPGNPQMRISRASVTASIVQQFRELLTGVGEAVAEREALAVAGGCAPNSGSRSSP
jgi:hypothetical protein